MSIDTQKQALAEARKRWGNKATVEQQGNRFTVADGPVYPRQEAWKCINFGIAADSWDAAFADADRKQDV